MPVFADHMKDFTDHLRISIENRTDALGQVHQATDHLLTAARTFMGNVSHEHHVMAGELHEVLDKFHGDLSDRVEDLRERHRASRKDMQAALRSRLDENTAARHEAVKSMRQTFRETRREIADDLLRGQQCMARIHGQPLGRGASSARGGSQGRCRDRPFRGSATRKANPRQPRSTSAPPNRRVGGNSPRLPWPRTELEEAGSRTT